VDEEERRELFEGGGHRHARFSRQVLLAASATSITDGQFFMNTACGLDNRHLCAPYLPVGRNSDGLFGTIMHACAEEAFFAHHPWVVLHDPPTRVWCPGDGKADAARVRVSDLLASWVNLAPLPSGTAEEGQRLTALGAYLKGLSELGAECLDAYVRTSVDRLNHLRMARLAARWNEFGETAPDSWKEDLQDQMEELGKAVRSGSSSVPSDLADSGIPFRTVAARYADLLIHWPRLMQVSALLKRSDKGVASPVGHAARTRGTAS
jgi:hypothetical protein